MKLWLPLITAEFAICLGSLAQTTPDKTWPLGPYDKVIPQRPTGIIFTSPAAPPALRGAIVPWKTATNALIAPGIKESK